MPLPQVVLDELTDWWKFHRHPRFLFPAMGHAWRATERRSPVDQGRVQRELLRSAEHPMRTSGMQRVFQLAVAASGVKKRATIHMVGDSTGSSSMCCRAGSCACVTSVTLRPEVKTADNADSADHEGLAGRCSPTRRVSPSPAILF